jgi:type I restriction enzyme S subunit
MSEETQAVREAIAVYAPEAAETKRVSPGYKQTEVGVIPEDWEPLPVGSMGEVVAGKALAANAPGLQRPYLRTKNVFDGRIELDDVLTMPMTGAEFARYELRDGDVLLNEGQTLELVGRCSIYRSEFPEPCAIQNQLIRFRARSGVSSAFAAHLFRYCQKTGVFAQIALQTTSVAHLGVSRFQKLTLAWPVSEAEQRTIATALSDVDDLISSLDSLIVKKRAVKAAAMQQLLTGKQRLPGFSGGWIMKRLGDVSSIKTGNKNNDDKLEDGRYPFFVRSQIVERINTYSFDGEAILVPGEGGIGSIFHYVNGRFDYHQRVYKISDFSAGACGKFIYYSMIQTFNKQATRNSVKATVDSLRLPTFLGFEFPAPTVEEQTAIAFVLSDMDAEIEALEARREKTQQIKQGMMQELLTGRTRLIGGAKRR